MSTLLASLILLLMAVGLLAVPVGLPGTWFMLVLMFVLVVVGLIPLSTWLFLLAAAGVVELAEFLILKALGSRFGASRKAFWGAVIGGIIGAAVGLPVPVVGSLVGAFVGTFLGAGIVTLVETRSLGEAGKVGYGVVLARTLAVVLKLCLGFAILVTAAFGVFS